MRVFFQVALLLLLAFVSAQANEKSLRVAIIGGMQTSGMWERVAAVFEQKHGIKVECVVSGNKKVLDEYVRERQVDFITMHSSDTISNLVADGLFEELTPWTRNAQMLVGVASNPAHIETNDTLEAALKKIMQTQTPFLVHPSGGTFEVVSALREEYDFLPKTIFLETKRGFLKEVAKQEGYTLFGVIPFLLQKQTHKKIRGYYIEDKRLQRPYLAAVAHASKISKESHKNAKKLLAFLNSQEVQEMIAAYRMEGFEAYPVFFPIQTINKEI